MCAGAAGCSASTGEKLYEEGMARLREGNYQASIVLFRNALEKEQNLPGARYQLARAYSEAGKLELAEKEFQKLARLNPAQEGLQLELAKLYIRMKKPDMAIANAEQHIKKNTDSTDAIELIAIANRQNNRPVEAEELLIRVLRMDPHRESATLELASLRIERGMADTARSALSALIAGGTGNPRAYHLLAEAEISLGSRERAIEALTRAVSLNPSDLASRYRIGILTLERGDEAAALAQAEELTARFPRSGEGYRLKGILLCRRGDYRQAAATLQQANKIQPSLSGSYYLGICLFNLGELENALSQFHQTIDRAPAFSQARLMSGLVLHKQRRFDDAISELKKLVASDSSNAYARHALGSSLMAQGHYEEGMREFDAATDLDPGLAETYMKKSVYHFSQGRMADAELDLTTAVRVAPDATAARVMLAAFHHQRGNDDKALSVLKKGLSGSRSDAVLLLAMARYTAADGNADDTASYLKSAALCDPGSIEPHLALAAWHISSDDFEGAVKVYTEAAARFPSHTAVMLRLATLLEETGRLPQAAGWFRKAGESGSAEALLELARHYRRTGNEQLATETVNQAVRKHPRSLYVMEQAVNFHLAHRRYKEAIKLCDTVETISPAAGAALKSAACLAAGRVEEALEQTRKMSALSPSSAAGHLRRAAIYAGSGRFDQARAEAAGGGEREPANRQIQLVIAEMHARKGDWRSAHAAYDRLLRSAPGYIPARLAKAALHQGRGERSAAIREYRAALAVSADMVPALNNLAMLYADDPSTAHEALKLAGRACRLEPRNPAARDTLGYARLKNGNSQDALKTLEHASRLAPDNPSISYHLALANLATGQRPRAVALLKRSIESPGFSEAPQARALFAELSRDGRQPSGGM